MGFLCENHFAEGEILISEMKNDVRKTEQYIPGDVAGRDGALVRLREVCRLIGVKLFFSKKVESDILYYKNKLGLVVIGENITNARVNDFMRIIGLKFD